MEAVAAPATKEPRKSKIKDLSEEDREKQSLQAMSLFNRFEVILS